IVTLANADMGYLYRKSNGPRGAVFVSAVYQGFAGEPQKILDEMRTVTERRESSQPTRAKTAGSTFKNPDGQSSWKLIDEAGGRGFSFGRAMMSDLHSNFLINTGEADAYEVETVGEAIRQKVRGTHGIELRWEVRRMGRFVAGREVREFLDGAPFTGMV
ncbi:MAG TPA: UDP-N-acetylenolpyruvoylglucosamine reductase, partial [Devosia sp.]|nr:UDP-N-acetylenolpyruvoylglucosamine reductase [Devosia sp.]